jgi:dihydroneopterin aldolase/2-amino-4-hydroxy-6-hydroxymethyldihydropteridine diphosphokinase
VIGKELGLDRIDIDGLVVMTVVGALAHEREAAQPVRVDLSIEADLEEAGRSDELTDTVHYGEVTEIVARVVRDATDTLLERLAQRIADAVLARPRVEAVHVTLTKLRPPIPEAVESTAVRIVRRRTPGSGSPPDEPHRALLALGSNLGDREGYLRFAAAGVGDVVAESQVFETAPIGGPDGQGPYLYMVVAVATERDPYALLRHCQRIEAAARRVRDVRWGPRTLDIDILFYDEITIDDPRLTIPHPRIAERRFVLAPLSEIAPERCPAGWEADLPGDEVVAVGALDR